MGDQPAYQRAVGRCAHLCRMRHGPDEAQGIKPVLTRPSSRPSTCTVASKSGSREILVSRSASWFPPRTHDFWPSNSHMIKSEITFKQHLLNDLTSAICHIVHSTTNIVLYTRTWALASYMGSAGASSAKTCRHMGSWRVMVARAWSPNTRGSRRGSAALNKLPLPSVQNGVSRSCCQGCGESFSCSGRSA